MLNLMHHDRTFLGNIVEGWVSLQGHRKQRFEFVAQVWCQPNASVSENLE